MLAGAASSQTTYTFNGNGNWSDTTNWVGLKVPPTMLPKLDSIVINPAALGECVMDVDQITPDSSRITVLAGKKLRLLKDIKSTKKSFSNRLHIIDSSHLQLVSDSAMLSQGIYEFTSADSIPFIGADDFIVGVEGEGYLCKVVSADYSRSASPGGLGSPAARPAFFRLLLRTIRAKLTEVIENASYDETFSIDNSFQGGSTGALSVNIPTLNFQNGPFTLTLSEANITLNPKWRLAFNIADYRLRYFEMSSRNSSLTTRFRLTGEASGAVTLVDEKKSLIQPKYKAFFTWLGPVPLLVIVKLDFVLKYSASIQATIRKSVLYNSTSTIDLGIKYNGTQWQPVYSLGTNTTVTPDATNGDANANITGWIGPETSVKLYGVVGPYFATGFKSEADVNVATSLDWDFTVNGWWNSTAGVNASILGADIVNYETEWNSQKLELYKTPFAIEKVSGDNQKALFNQYVSQPVKVRVLDKFNFPQRYVPVYFTSTAGGGVVDEDSVWTDASGYAETRWKMGVEYGVEQKVEVSIQKADGSRIGSAIIFSAKTPTLVGSWTLVSFANGVAPGVLVEEYVAACPGILLGRYSELIDNYSIDSTRFSNFNRERWVSSGLAWTPDDCTVVGTSPVIDTTYDETTIGSYTVTGNIVTYTSDNGGSRSYSFQFLTFDRIKVDENEYVR